MSTAGSLVVLFSTWLSLSFFGFVFAACLVLFSHTCSLYPAAIPPPAMRGTANPSVPARVVLFLR